MLESEKYTRGENEQYFLGFVTGACFVAIMAMIIAQIAGCTS